MSYNQDDAALASARPAPAKEQGEEAALREALDDCVTAFFLPGDHCEMEQAIERASALLARKPNSERGPEVDRGSELLGELMSYYNFGAYPPNVQERVSEYVAEVEAKVNSDSIRARLEQEG